jgi:hypothetical protein
VSCLFAFFPLFRLIEIEFVEGMIEIVSVRNILILEINFRNDQMFLSRSSGLGTIALP